MKLKKRAVCALLCGVLAVGLMACQGETKSPEKEPSKDQEAVGKITDLKEVLKSDTTLVATTEVAFTIPFPKEGNLDGMQGGYTDGNYYYQNFIKRDNASGELNNAVGTVKYDIAKKQVVKESEILALNHANDITYNSKLDMLIIANATPRKNMLTFMNPDDLTIVKEVELVYDIFSIDYNEATDRYIVGIAGGQCFCILDADFNPVSSIYDPTTRTVGYTTQGVTCDDDFIYFVLYQQNVITVYDWEGNFVTLVKLDISGTVEPENISVVGNDIYIGCAGGGMQVYKVTGIVPEE